MAALSHSPVRPILVPLRTNGTKTPLILIHGVDGEIDRFRTFALEFEPCQPIYAIRAQALTGTPHALASIEQLAALYLQEILQVLGTTRVHLLGFSFGGYLAYEMGRILHARYSESGLVAILDTRPMHPVADRYQPDPPPARSVSAQHRSSLWNGRLKSWLAALSQRFRGRLLRALYACFTALHRPIPRLFQNAYYLHWFAAKRYSPQPTGAPLVILVAARPAPDPDDFQLNLWTALAPRGVTLHQIAGQHENLFESPFVGPLARVISGHL